MELQHGASRASRQTQQENQTHPPAAFASPSLHYRHPPWRIRVRVRVGAIFRYDRNSVNRKLFLFP
jgi:hypothetical protein